MSRSESEDLTLHIGGSVLTHHVFFCSEFLQFIIRHYGHALEYGSKYIYQCMPRMLTLWLDFGSNVPDTGMVLQNRSLDRIQVSTVVFR